MSQLFTVTVTDLGTYRVTVAADDAKAAAGIAKTVLFEEATTLPPDVAIIKREAEAVAVPTEQPPVRRFDVPGTYSIAFSITVPAATREEAERHAKRVYEWAPFPWEHSTGEDTIIWRPAREVQS